MKCQNAESPYIAPELVQTGWHPPHPTWKCPVCNTLYWEHDIKDENDNVIGSEIKPTVPAKWGQKSVEHYKSLGNAY